MSVQAREPLATIKAGRRTGCAVVTIERNGCVRRHRVSLKRYHAFFRWTNERCPWRTSGAWMRHGLDITIWDETFSGIALKNQKHNTGRRSGSR